MRILSYDLAEDDETVVLSFNAASGRADGIDGTPLTDAGRATVAGTTPSADTAPKGAIPPGEAGSAPQAQEGSEEPASAEACETDAGGQQAAGDSCPARHDASTRNLVLAGLALLLAVSGAGAWARRSKRGGALPG